MKSYKELLLEKSDTIKIKPSPTADTRTSDYANVTKSQLLRSSKSHIADVAKGLELFASMLKDSADKHDHDKISDIDGFHKDFLTVFKTTDWYENHKVVNRHHLNDKEGIPDDVNLVDVIEMITDCVMAGLDRSGEVYDLKLPNQLLQTAFQNTVELLKSKVKVK